MDPSPYDHLQPTTADYPAGVYRVVGLDRQTVTVLRITDGDGRRITTGTVHTIRRGALDGFVSTANPDANRSLRRRLQSIPATVYWSGRAFCRELISHPGLTSIALGLIAVGLVDPLNGPLSDRLAGVLIIVGSFGLAYLGSGRFSASR